MKQLHPLVMLMLTTWVMGQTAFASNIDLSTLPPRDTVQLTIYNSEDLTLVRETRTMSFKSGRNTLQFSWANTLIDPTSVTLRFLQHEDQLSVQQTTFPHDRKQMLFWTVNSQIADQVRVEISYFTSGIAWSADYVGISNADESTLNLDGFIRIHNQSGEDYEHANIRLVVGNINLIDKIATLGRLSLSEIETLPTAEFDKWRNKAAQQVLLEYDEYEAKDTMFLDVAPEEKAKVVKKVGLSEYYIYSIEGQENIPNGWSKRMISFQGKDIPMRAEYRYRPREYGHQLVKLFLFNNDKAAHLGETPLPKGQVRLFKRQQQSLQYLASLTLDYVPIGDKVELNLGQDPEIVFEQVTLQTWRNNVWMRYHKGRVHRRIRDKKIKVDHKASVSGWQDHSLYNQRIRNFSNRAITVEWRKRFSGDIVFYSQLKPILHDYETVQISTQVPAQSTQDHLFELSQKQGRSQKQNQIVLQQKAVTYPDFLVTRKR